MILFWFAMFSFFKHPKKHPLENLKFVLPGMCSAWYYTFYVYINTQEAQMYVMFGNDLQNLMEKMKI